MNLDKIKSLLIKIANSEPCIKKLYLFGSRVKGTHRENSDIDIAVKFDYPELNLKEVDVAQNKEGSFCVTMDKIESLKNQLQPFFPFPVDLQLKDSSTPKVNYYVEKSGILIYTKNSAKQ